MRIRFAPRLVPTLAAFAMIALTLSLGRWQTNRAEEKTARQAMFEARIRETPLVLGGSSGPADTLLYRRVRVHRAVDRRRPGLHRQPGRAGQGGFHVMTPLRVAGSARAVLVNRGWVARTRSYPQAASRRGSRG
jgi:surfeit locus 1 family protein